MFAAKLGIKGLWTGLFTCVSLQCVFLIFYLVRMNWKTATEEAQVRAGVCETSNDTSPQPEDAEDSLDQTDTADPAAGQERPAEVRRLKCSFSNMTPLCRRLLALAVMLQILAIGIIINLVLT
ncbi:multidrug and toxin extrusion protein 2 [Austrofundulus limnaeus]|uniref:Multidrug and toxin extrusion protein 2 n=1 Tax=Austrofundulus limnaeus TaxID=52670 RepID=A0A2I4DBM8_AUSLI|nr:PREDICTED: multidrug and toxin extrusion protein 2-like [Austrofundulus limnaeus]